MPQLAATGILPLLAAGVGGVAKGALGALAEKDASAERLKQQRALQTDADKSVDFATDLSGPPQNLTLNTGRRPIFGSRRF